MESQVGANATQHVIQSPRTDSARAQKTLKHFIFFAEAANFQAVNSYIMCDETQVDTNRFVEVSFSILRTNELGAEFQKGDTRLRSCADYILILIWKGSVEVQGVEPAQKVAFATPTQTLGVLSDPMREGYASALVS